MHDQAHDLRRLAWHAAPAASEAKPRLVVATGGKGGVGTTTLAVNLAAAAAGRGLRTVLVDADPGGGDVRTLCRFEEHYTIGDVMAGRQTVAEALQPGPAGLRVLSGTWATSELADSPAEAHQRLIQSLLDLGDQADLVLVDAGSGLNRLVRHLWQAADEVLLVTTTDLASVMDAYASIKVFASAGAAPIFPLINRTLVRTDENDVFSRLQRACLRFLGLQLGGVGSVVHDPEIGRPDRDGKPFVLACPGRPAARQMTQLAERLIERAKRAQASDPQKPIYTDTLGRRCHVKL